MSPYYGTSLFLVAGKPETDFIPRSVKVGLDYFRLMGIPLRAGRYITARDDERSTRVAVISESLWRRVFGDENPIGQRFVGDLRDRERSTYEIVGVVADADLSDPRSRNSRECVYVSYLQAAFTPQAMTIHARVPRESDPGAVVSSVQRAVNQVAPRVAVYDIRTIEEAKDAMLSAERLVTTLTGFFAIAAALLCAVGIYGMVARDAAARTREIGIRLTLGCPRRQLFASMARTSAVFTILGVGTGLALVAAVAPSLAPMLTDVHFADPVVYAASALLLIGVSAIAVALPARRAASTDPAAALRHD